MPSAQGGHSTPRVIRPSQPPSNRQVPRVRGARAASAGAGGWLAGVPQHLGPPCASSCCCCTPTPTRTWSMYRDSNTTPKHHTTHRRRHSPRHSSSKGIGAHGRAARAKADTSYSQRSDMLGPAVGRGPLSKGARHGCNAPSAGGGTEHCRTTAATPTAYLLSTACLHAWGGQPGA